MGIIDLPSFGTRKKDEEFSCTLKGRFYTCKSNWDQCYDIGKKLPTITEGLLVLIVSKSSNRHCSLCTVFKKSKK